VPWFLDIPANAAFHAAVGNLVNTAVSPYNVQGAWAGDLLFQTAAAQALKSTSSPTAKDMYTALYALSGTTLGGFAPPLHFTKGSPGVANCFFVVSIQNGKFTAPDGTTDFCQPAGS
jgi:hypothetical protein